MRLDTSGNLGLGVTPSAWEGNTKALQIANAGAQISASSTGYSGANFLWVGNNSYLNTSNNQIYARSAAASLYRQSGAEHAWFNAASGTAGGTISFTQAMTLDASGNLALGDTSAYYATAQRVTIDILGGSNGAILSLRNSTNRQYLYSSGADLLIQNDTTTGNIIFGTNSSIERARITSGGDLLVGTTSAVQFNTTTVTGWNVNSAGQSAQAASSGTVAFFNRLTDDGTIVSLRQAGVEEGTISVSGATVSYNAFAGSHWSQLKDGSKPDILRGTVMESINELCEWPGESNERLPKAKISDTAGSRKVYGVFMAWDNDWSETNDMYVTAVGAFICRVNGSVTVQEGDLLESNGDGTARVQADEIIRSSTIGKVTSTVKTHEYDDGSYCVPTVLYCG
jgi:hypothetical protein